MTKKQAASETVAELRKRLAAAKQREVEARKEVADVAEQLRATETTETRVATLTIDNCLDCPRSKEIRDPSSPDSFDFQDVSLCCTLAPRSVGGRGKTDLGETIPGRFIIACERSIRRAEAKVPEWCPLLEAK